MGMCKWGQKVEAYFDNEMAHAGGVEAHLGECPDCSAYLEQLQIIRGHAEATSAVRPIEDAQFNAFMAGIREGIETPRYSGARSFWALMSLGTAALVVALAVFSMFTGPAPVRATDVESTRTDLEGYTVDVNKSNDITTIAIIPPQRYEEDIQ